MIGVSLLTLWAAIQVPLQEPAARGSAASQQEVSAAPEELPLSDFVAIEAPVTRTPVARTVVITTADVRKPVLGEPHNGHATGQEPSAFFGCVFENDRPTDTQPRFFGIGIYTPPGDPDGPTTLTVFDPRGILGPRGFSEIVSGPDWVSFEGPNLLHVDASAGGIPGAKLKTEKGWSPPRPGKCQTGGAIELHEALEQFTDLLRELNSPETPNTSR